MKHHDGHHEHHHEGPPRRPFEKAPWDRRPDEAGPTGPPRGRGHGGPPPWLHGLFGLGQDAGRGPRVRRGDVRAAILDVLSGEQMNGYQVIQRIAERSGGAWKPSPGSVYLTLQLIEDEALIAGEEADGRRRFTLTEAGRAEAERIGPGQPPPWEQMTEDVGETLLRLRESFGQLFGAVQAVHGGTEEQQAKAAELLTETRRRLYAILAEDERGA